jgi:CBS domain-containing protein
MAEKKHLVKDLMQANPIRVSTKSSLTEAAELMAQEKVGALPVHKGDGEYVVGFLTDRDIAMRGVAKLPNMERKVKS